MSQNQEHLEEGPGKCKTREKPQGLHCGKHPTKPTRRTPVLQHIEVPMPRRFFNRGQVPSRDPQGLHHPPPPRGRGGVQLHPGNQEGIIWTQPAVTATWEKTGGSTC